MNIVDVSDQPLWLSAAGRILRKAPFGRYRVGRWLAGLHSRPFWGRMPLEQGEAFFVCHLADLVARDVFISGRYEPLETLILKRTLKEGMTFVDVGANWGYFAILAADLVGRTGRVHAFEPDPRNVELFKANIRRNQLDQIHLHEVAVSNVAGSAKLLGFDESGGNFGVSTISAVHHETAGARFEIQTVCLDDLFEHGPLQHVDLLKMDIEGAEGLALEGLNKTLGMGKIDRILLELHPQLLREQGGSTVDLINRITRFGYSVLVLDHNPTSQRELSYGGVPDIRKFLQPYDPTMGLVDSWPHVLCLRNGLGLL